MLAFGILFALLGICSGSIVKVGRVEIGEENVLVVLKCDRDEGDLPEMTNAERMEMRERMEQREMAHSGHEPPMNIEPGEELGPQLCDEGETLGLYVDPRYEIPDGVEFSIFVAEECHREIPTTLEGESFEINSQGIHQLTVPTLPGNDPCSPFCIMVAASPPNQDGYYTFIKHNMLNGADRCMGRGDAALRLSNDYQEWGEVQVGDVTPVTDSEGNWFISAAQILADIAQSGLEVEWVPDMDGRVPDWQWEHSIAFFLSLPMVAHTDWFNENRHDDACMVADVQIGDMVLGVVNVVSEGGAAPVTVPFPQQADGNRIYFTGPHAESFSLSSLCHGELHLMAALDWNHATADRDRCNNIMRMPIHIQCPEAMVMALPETSIKMFYNPLEQGHALAMLVCGMEIDCFVHSYMASEKTWRRTHLEDLSPMEKFGLKRFEMLSKMVVREMPQDRDVCDIVAEYDSQNLDPVSNPNALETCKNHIREIFRTVYCECDGDLEGCRQARPLIMSAIEDDSCGSYEPAREFFLFFMASDEVGDNEDAMWMHLVGDNCSDVAFHRSIARAFMGGGDISITSLRRMSFFMDLLDDDNGEVDLGIDDCDAETTMTEEQRFNVDTTGGDCGPNPFGSQMQCIMRILAREMDVNRARFLRMNFDLRRILRLDLEGYQQHGHEQDWEERVRDRMEADDGNYMEEEEYMEEDYESYEEDPEDIEEDCSEDMDMLRPARHAPYYYRVFTPTDMPHTSQIQLSRRNPFREEDAQFCWKTIAITACPHCMAHAGSYEDYGSDSYGGDYYGSNETGGGPYPGGDGYGDGYGTGPPSDGPPSQGPPSEGPPGGPPFPGSSPQPGF